MLGLEDVLDFEDVFVPGDAPGLEDVFDLEDVLGLDDPPEVNDDEGFCLALVPVRLAEDMINED